MDSVLHFCFHKVNWDTCFGARLELASQLLKNPQPLLLLYLENIVFEARTSVVIGSSDKFTVRNLTTRDQRFHVVLAFFCLQRTSFSL